MKKGLFFNTPLILKLFFNNWQFARGRSGGGVIKSEKVCRRLIWEILLLPPPLLLLPPPLCGLLSNYSFWMRCKTFISNWSEWLFWTNEHEGRSKGPGGPLGDVVWHIWRWNKKVEDLGSSRGYVCPCRLISCLFLSYSLLCPSYFVSLAFVHFQQTELSVFGVVL